MDLTPGALRETTFRGALRGYNVDDVDEFVERVSVGVGDLLEQLRLVSERAAGAERRAKEVATSEDAMKRTLGHAQKLGEAVLAEARQEAARVGEEARRAAGQLRIATSEEASGEHHVAVQARAEAERLRREAEGERAAVRAEAEALRAAVRAEADVVRSEARSEVEAMRVRVAEGVDAEIRAEVERVHGVRRALQLDVAVLTRWMHDQRHSVRHVLAEALEAIDRSTLTDDPPPLTDVGAIPAPLAPRAASAPAPPPAGVTPPPSKPPPIPPAPPPRQAPAPPSPVAGPAEAPDAPPSGAAHLPAPALPELSDEEFLAELKEAELKEAELKEAELKEAELKEAELKEAEPKEAELQEVTGDGGDAPLEPREQDEPS